MSRQQPVVTEPRLRALLADGPQPIARLLAALPPIDAHSLRGRLAVLERAGVLAREYPPGQPMRWALVPGAMWPQRPPRVRPLCRVCGLRPVRAGGRCARDYSFWYRTGRDRAPRPATVGA